MASFFRSAPVLTRGQKFEADRASRAAARKDAMKYVVAPFIDDLQNKINADSILDPQQLVFVYESSEILAHGYYSKSVFAKACGNSKQIPYQEELLLMATGFADSAKDQDYGVRVERDGLLITVSFKDVTGNAIRRVEKEIADRQAAEDLKVRKDALEKIAKISEEQKDGIQSLIGTLESKSV